MAWEIPKAELAYLLSADAEGHGYTQEALGAVVLWAFLELGLGRIYCQLRPENMRSAQLFSVCNFGTKAASVRTTVGLMGNSMILTSMLCCALSTYPWLAKARNLGLPLVIKPVFA